MDFDPATRMTFEPATLQRLMSSRSNDLRMTYNR